MNLTGLLEMLIGIEWSLRLEDPSIIRQRLMEAEECVLAIHRELVQRGKIVEAASGRNGSND